MDGEREFLHPLTPQLRNSWELVKFDPHAKKSYKATQSKKTPKEDAPETGIDTDDDEDETMDGDAELS